MKPLNSTKILNPILLKELLDLGRYCRQLRVQHKLTIADMCERIGVSPRTVSKIEKGDPTVSVGTLMEYLNIVGLAQGLSQRILGDYLYAIMQHKKTEIFTDDQMDF